MEIDELKARRAEILFAIAAGNEAEETDAHELERVEAAIRDLDDEEAAQWEEAQEWTI